MVAEFPHGQEFVVTVDHRIGCRSGQQQRRAILRRDCRYLQSWNRPFPQLAEARGVEAELPGLFIIEVLRFLTFSVEPLVARANAVGLRVDAGRQRRKPGCGFGDEITANCVSEAHAPVDQPADIRDAEPVEVVVASGVHADEDDAPRTIANVDDRKRRTAWRIQMHGHGDISFDFSIPDDAAINLGQLRVFFFVAREQSFTRAAHQLNITQPAASTRVRELERDCGSRLFDRIGQRVILTDAGEMLFGYAQRIFQLLEDADHALENARQLKSGSIRIGTGQTAADFVSPILARFKRTYPGVTVRVDLGNSKKTLEDVLNFQLHLGLVANPPADRELIILPCIREPMVLVVPMEHSWAKRRAVPLKAVHAQPFITREPGSGTRALVETALERVGASPRVEMELPLNAAIKGAVEAGIGVAIMPESVIRQQVGARQLARIKIRDHRLTMAIDWVFLKDRAEAPVLQVLAVDVAAHLPPLSLLRFNCNIIRSQHRAPNIQRQARLWKLVGVSARPRLISAKKRYSSAVSWPNARRFCHDAAKALRLAKMFIVVPSSCTGGRNRAPHS